MLIRLTSAINSTPNDENKGQNVRLAAKLTGYGIDIKSEAEPEEHTEEENLDEEYVEPSEISLDEE